MWVLDTAIILLAGASVSDTVHLREPTGEHGATNPHAMDQARCIIRGWFGDGFRKVAKPLPSQRTKVAYISSSTLVY